MGTTVRLLDDTLVDQIAAGEVIERPSNLVKELLENAIDAGATAITVSVEDGGRGQVRVVDDGIGMSAEDAALSIERHATSKIRSFDDLVQVNTLGFRGEALPSIGSVAKMTITTRPKAALEGTRVIVEGGVLRDIGPAGCPPGTSVEVSDLFYNVPARKKFLRARQTETSRIFEVCQRAALSHPELRLVVTSDGRAARRYLPASSLTERAHQVFGEGALHEVHVERDGIVLDAALAPAESARPGARQLFLLVNGRAITDRALARAIAFAYGDRLPPGHYPRGVVSLRLPPEDVDVNAHPQKTEVRFRHGARLVDLVTRMLAPRLPAASRGDGYWDARLGSSPPEPSRLSAPRVAPLGVGESQESYAAQLPNGLRWVAQVRDALLVCESADELLVLDRAAADVLGRLAALREEHTQGKVTRQHLLFPDRVTLSSTEETLLAREEAQLESLGFEWSPLGGGVQVIRAVPAPVSDGPSAALFKAALESLREPSKDGTDTALHAMAKASASRNGTPLSEGDAIRIAGSVAFTSDDHRACVVARAPLQPITSKADDD